MREAPIQIIYFEPSEIISTAMDSLIRATPGFAILHYWTVKDFEVAALKPEVDCLLIETDRVENWAKKLVGRIRRAMTDADPFLPIFTIHSPITQSQLGLHAAAGVDTMFAKPHSVGIVFEHLKAIASQPRFFVAEGDYVGPDRRHDARPPDPRYVFEVPNRFLLRKSAGTLDNAQVTGWAKAWREVLNTPPQNRPGMLPKGPLKAGGDGPAP